MPSINPTAGQSASELKRQIEVEREGAPFLVYRTEDGAQEISSLGGRDRVTVGRGPGNEICLDFDDEVSGVHAELEHIGGEWILVDDGMSKNGSLVNGERVSGRARLRDRDLIGVGQTGLLFRAPSGPGGGETKPASEAPGIRDVTDTQRQILIALCRPFRERSDFASPATNKEIAAEVHLSVDAVKGHLRVLFERFDVVGLPQNQKRIRLSELAMRAGTVTPKDLD